MQQAQGVMTHKVAINSRDTLQAGCMVVEEQTGHHISESDYQHWTTQDQYFYKGEIVIWGVNFFSLKLGVVNFSIFKLATGSQPRTNSFHIWPSQQIVWHYTTVEGKYDIALFHRKVKCFTRIACTILTRIYAPTFCWLELATSRGGAYNWIKVISLVYNPPFLQC